jgi:hypothetical protein
VKLVAIPLQQFVTAGPKIVVGLPMYRQVSVTWLTRWLQIDKQPCTGLVLVEGVRLPIAMKAITETAFRKFPDWDWLTIYEDDILPPPDAFQRIINYPDICDIVGSLNHMHNPPHPANAYTLHNRDATPIYKNITPGTLHNWTNPPGLHEVDAVAMGFTAIRRHTLQNWNSDTPMWQPIPPIQGQDIHFCHEAKKQGNTIWLDTAMQCGHLTEVEV